MRRRDFLRLSLAGAAGLAAAACSRGTTGPQLPDGTPEGLADEVRALARSGAGFGLQVFPGGQEFIAERTERLPLGLVDPEGFSVAGGDARVWVAPLEGPAAGPVDATYRAYERVLLGDDPKGFYEAAVPMPGTGIADVLAAVRTGGITLYGWTTVFVRDRATVPDVGEEAIPVATPTSDDARGVENICTRVPACPLHDRPLDDILAEGRPVVYTISSPLLCTSRTCGPVLEEVLGLHDRYGARAGFVHAEPYRGNTPTDLAPAATAWRLQSEPWTFVIDASGTVAARFEGPVVADEIEPALRALGA